MSQMASSGAVGTAERAYFLRQSRIPFGYVASQEASENVHTKPYRIAPSVRKSQNSTGSQCFEDVLPTPVVS